MLPANGYLKTLCKLQLGVSRIQTLGKNCDAVRRRIWKGIRRCRVMLNDKQQLYILVRVQKSSNNNNSTNQRVHNVCCLLSDLQRFKSGAPHQSERLNHAGQMRETQVVTNSKMSQVYVYLTSSADQCCRQDAFTLDVTEAPQGAGSGVVWDMQGRIVTNFHVIKGASDI